MSLTLDDFDFALPAERIALHPARPRDHARLLSMLGGMARDCRIVDLPTLLSPGDLIVVNDSRVIPARLDGIRPRRTPSGAEAAIHANLIKRESADQFAALVRPARRLRIGDRVVFAGDLVGEVIEPRGEGEVALRFELSGIALDHHLLAHGQMPLPPYIAARRAANAEDRADYQTIFATKDGSVAAPTAGLHFTPRVLGDLRSRGIDQVAVTLHVGAGTFLPVKTARIDQHVMHSEWGEIPPKAAAAINAARARGGRIVSIGTTALRLLESACDGQGRISAYAGETAIFIRPGHRVRSADLLWTNFHLPRSTLLMLLAAFAGFDTMKAGYAHALAHDYRFFSYGDASLWDQSGHEVPSRQSH